MWEQYKVVETSREPYTYQIYELWQTNPDGTAEYSLFPKGNDYLFFKTKKDAEEHIAQLTHQAQAGGEEN